MGVVQVLRLQEHGRSLRDEEIPMIDEAEERAEEDESEFIQPPLAEPESLLPSMATVSSQKRKSIEVDIDEEEEEDKKNHVKPVKIAIENRNRKVLFRNLPFCSDIDILD